MASILAGGVLSGRAHAQSTDIANLPLQATGRAKPNIMLLLDNSVSMQSSYTGDEVLGLLNRIGYRSHLCNAQYYDPGVRYQLPPRENGSRMALPGFDRAPYDGFRSGSVTTNLSNGFRAWRSSATAPADHDSDCWQSSTSVCRTFTNQHPNASERAYYYEFIGSHADRQRLGSSRDVDDPALDRCWVSTTNSADGHSNWRKVSIDGVSGPDGNPDERQNFAIWYSYYRTRLLAMKSAVSIAFEALDDQFRIGFSTIHYPGTDDGSSRFVSIRGFDNSQRARLLRKLQDSGTDDGTPLRAALSKAGRIFAGTIGADPMQYSCQANYAILATDGAWSDSGEGSDFGPLTETGARVGDADGHLPRPKYGNTAENVATRNTLADVAAYFRNTDLRPASACNRTDLCTNNVPGPDGKGTFQHMKTYAISLGVSGTLAYRDDYQSASAGSFADIVSGKLHWPDPSREGLPNPQRVDDLWHAAVNGDGQYFNTQNIRQLQAALRSALESIVTQSGADSPITFDGAATQGSRFAYAASFRSSAWDGDLVASMIDAQTGKPGARVWSAAEKLNRRVAAGDDRIIYLFDANTPSRLKPLLPGSLSDAEKALLASACSGTNPLAQCSRLNASQSAALNAGMVSYLRGQRQPEEIFRSRTSVLGDIINSAPLHVGRPTAPLSDGGYQDFASLNRNRADMVYVGANDGMLHAFAAATGEEAWAYIPPAMLPRLTRLADQRYASRHQYTVDGTVVSADICIARTGCDGSKWRTLLVGGFNAGGVGYYAMDITDPANPRALWNYNSDATLGLSFGNPLILRLPDGTWSVVFASGYNNPLGGGHLYVLDAWTGVLLKTISTGAGTSLQPGGLARIAAGADAAGTAVYGGDLLGNLWRFNIDPAVAAGQSVSRVATFRSASESQSPAQPITTAPVMMRAYVGNQLRNLIVVGTGRYLGETDKTNTDRQTLYVLQDVANGSPLENPRNNMAARKLLEVDGTRTIESGVEVDWTRQAGWYLDLGPAKVSTGERINVDMQVNGSLLTFAGNVPSANACEQGSAWFYALDLKTGQVREPTAGTAITRLSGGLLVGFAPRQAGKLMSMLLVADSGAQSSLGNWQNQGASAKRVSWRELAD